MYAGGGGVVVDGMGEHIDAGEWEGSVVGFTCFFFFLLGGVCSFGRRWELGSSTECRTYNEFPFLFFVI